MSNILVVNDDGINSKLIHLLAQKLMRFGNVVLMAPIEEKSAHSHMINIFTYKETNIIKCPNYPYEAYMVNGSPADCTRYATDFLNKKFDYVFSGINNGSNLGIDILYSGTVSAAMEGTLRGIKACALSAFYNDYDICYDYLDNVLDYVFDNNLLDKDYTLNVNFPKKITNSNIYQPTYQYANLGNYSSSDIDLANKGHITITPLKIDKTDYQILENLKNKKKTNENIDFFGKL